MSVPPNGPPFENQPGDANPDPLPPAVSGEFRARRSAPHRERPPDHGLANPTQAYDYGDGYGPLEGTDRFADATRFRAGLHRYELILRKYWWIMLLALCVSLGPASWYIYTTPPAYRSTAKLWMSGKLNLKENQLYSEELSSFLGTQVELLKSTTVYDAALARMRKTETNSGSALSATNTAADNPAFSLTAESQPKTSVIELQVTGREPEEVRSFLTAIIDEYQAYKKETRLQSSDFTLASITDQTTALEKELRRQQELQHNFMASNNVVLLQEQGNSAGAYVSKLNRQLADLRTEYQMLQLLSQAQLTETTTRSMQGGSGPPQQDDPSREVLMNLSGPQAEFFKATQQIELLKAERNEIYKYLFPNHPKILKLDEDIARQAQVVEVYKSLSRSQIQNRRQSLEIQMKTLETSIIEWEAKAIDASRQMAQYERIRQDVQRTQGLYERLLGVIQSVDVNRTLDQESVRVMERASAAKPIRKTFKILTLGVVLGLFMGLGLVYVIARFDDRFTSIAELRNHLSEIIVGQVPNVALTDSQSIILGSGVDDEHHAFAESFRNMRSALLYMFSGQKRLKTIVITSATPAEGKTTIAANLAITLAVSGTRVLLVDGDLRRAKMHQLFDVPRTPGLAEILEQETNYRQAIVPTKIPNLFLLPAGEASVNPGELFLAPSIDLFLTKIRSEYDYIILDSAPVMAADDTSALAPKLDGVIFVVRGDYTSARMARESVAALQDRQANVLGVVFNRAVSSRADNYYYYRYNDYYYRKPGSKRKRDKTSGPSGAVKPPGPA
jgi:capsular exopolysaccharide synthesis family protein